jgi:hypothetical protein
MFENKGTTFLFQVSTIILITCYFSTLVVAQGANAPSAVGFTNPQCNSESIIKAGTDGVFILNGNKLTAYDLSLHERSSITLGKKASDNMPSRGSAASMLITPGPVGSTKLLVVIENKFYCLNTSSLEVMSKADLPELRSAQSEPQRPASSDSTQAPPLLEEQLPSIDDTIPGGGANNLQGPPNMGGNLQPGIGSSSMEHSLELHEQILYIMRSSQIIAVNITNGSIVGKTNLTNKSNSK